MQYINLLNEVNMPKAILMIFTEGTVIKHKNLLKIFSFASYIPVGNSVAKINGWFNQGVSIYFITSRTSKKQVNQIINVLKSFDFKGNRLYYRNKGQQYHEIIESVKPDILIEDDCKSIGGIKKNVYNKSKPRY